MSSSHRLLLTWVSTPRHSNRLDKMAKELDPSGVQSRTFRMKRKRVKRWYAGPNIIWSVDGHAKVEFVGIEIYGCIDCFSRKIIWLYVGVSSHTEVSVVRQYLDVVQACGFSPELIRSDRGVETPMLAEAHYTIRCENDELRDRVRSSRLPFRSHAADGDGQLALTDCYLYGTSTRNLSIEEWWGQLLERQLHQWIVSGIRKILRFTMTNPALGLFQKNASLWRLLSTQLGRPNCCSGGVHAIVAQRDLFFC